MLADPDLWHPLRSGRMMARWGAAMMPRQYDALAGLARGQDTILVANPGLLPARLVHGRLIRAPGGKGRAHEYRPRIAQALQDGVAGSAGLDQPNSLASARAIPTRPILAAETWARPLPPVKAPSPVKNRMRP